MESTAIEPLDQPMTKRDFLTLFRLIGAFAEKVTGERPTLKHEVNADESIHIYPDGEISWVKRKAS